MHGGFPDFEQARADLMSGAMKWSAMDDKCAALVRQLAEVYMCSAGIVATELSTPGHSISRSAVISLARRVKPEVIFQSAGYRGGGNCRGTRRARLAASNNLSTHKVRLQRAVEEKRRQFGYIPFESRFGGINAPPAGAARIAARRMTVPRCMWAGCGGELENVDKDCYCSTHKRMAR